MARPKSIPIRRTLRVLFPTTFLTTLARATGAVQRMRNVDPVDLFWTVVLGFGTGRHRTIAGLRRAYQKTTGDNIEESSFYNRFTDGFVRMLKEAVAHALQKNLGVGRALRGPLAKFRDVLMTDSTVVRLHEMLAKAFPACRTNHTKAALKAHVVISVTGAGKQSIKVTAERAHDGPIFRVGKWVKDRLLLFDLGYFRYQLFASITHNGGYFLSRLKGNANPRIVAVNRAYRGRAIPLVGEKLLNVVGQMKRQVLDVDVEVSYQHRAYRGRRRGGKQILRVVGILDAESNVYHLYVTNVPPDKLAAEDIQAVYALRWEIELLFRELKSHYRMEDMPSSKRVVVEALLYAAILTLVVSRRLLALVRRELGEGFADRVPHRRWAALLESVAQDLLAIVTRPPRTVRDLLERTSEMLLHEAPDPNKSRAPLLQAVETGTHRYRSHCG